MTVEIAIVLFIGSPHSLANRTLATDSEWLWIKNWDKASHLVDRRTVGRVEHVLQLAVAGLAKHWACLRDVSC